MTSIDSLLEDIDRAVSRVHPEAATPLDVSDLQRLCRQLAAMLQEESEARNNIARHLERFEGRYDAIIDILKRGE